MDRSAKRSTSLPSSRKALHGVTALEEQDSKSLADTQISNEFPGKVTIILTGLLVTLQVASARTVSDNLIPYLHAHVHTTSGRRDIQDRSLAIPLPVRPDSQALRRVSTQLDDADISYIKVWELDQAGHGFIALKDADRLPLVLLKTRSSITPKQRRSLRRALHQNLVGLYGFQCGEASITLIYRLELLAVSLACVTNSPGVQFSESDAATVCKEVLLGLDYIHSELEIIHGDIDYTNILLNIDGEIKIGK